MKQMKHDSEMKKHGDAAMGFDQDKVAHHFLLKATGGIIEVGALDAADQSSRQQIRTHLRTISNEFAQGTFDSPTATHGEVPPGVEGMRNRKAQIAYSYAETPAGARVIIKTVDKNALIAVHNFLRYQIREHKTGDPISLRR